jgi:lipopolysaccharide biosynthesis glycosyltransferase
VITPLVLSRLELAGIMRRPTRRIPKGKGLVIKDGRIERRVITAAQSLQLWDEISDAPMATQFANSRFATPILAQTGWAAFLDCDVVALGDIGELFALADPDKAIMCVQHGRLAAEGLKMDGQIQTAYNRKNWSSVMLFNCDHPKNRGLTLDLINKRPGRDLHRFCWLEDDDIGNLPPEWNWLVNVQPRPDAPKIAHFTLGGPWLENWSRQRYDDVWLGASQNC